MPARFEKATAAAIEKLPRESTVFFFPVGALEDHGPHLPLGLDLMESERLVWAAAEKLERELTGWHGVIMPAAPLGVQTVTGALALKVGAHVLRDWLVDACTGLARAGFKHFVCFSPQGGPRQLTAIEEAGKMLRRRQRGLAFWRRSGLPTLVSASSAHVGFREAMKSPFWLDPLEHGGKRDTSVALAIAGSGVEETYRTLPSAERPSRGRKLRGYWGNPAQADAAEGERLIREELEAVFPKLRAIWSGSDPQGLFRSWYSVLPPNSSLFKAWLLAIAIVAMLYAWILLDIRSTLAE